MYWNTSNRPGYRIPVRRAPIGSASPYPDRRAGFAEPEIKQPPAEAEAAVAEAQVTEPQVVQKPAAEEINWKEMALRLQADMDNFRKRQTRRADEAIAAERERLLQRVLPLADNLARALDPKHQEENSLRQGIELIQRELMRLLAAEDVTPIETVGQPFNPELHEALATTPAQAEPDTVVEEIEAGYRLGDKLLRPAKVIVAV